MAAWCGIAQQLETINDHLPGHHSDRLPAAFYTPQERHINALLAHAADIINTAHHLNPTPAGPLQDQTAWQPALETAARHLAARRPAPEIDRDLGLGL
jgi:hypothetical protein